jgi:hypothetical protein
MVTEQIRNMSFVVLTAMTDDLLSSRMRFCIVWYVFSDVHPKCEQWLQQITGYYIPETSNLQIKVDGEINASVRNIVTSVR